MKKIFTVLAVSILFSPAAWCGPGVDQTFQCKEVSDGFFSSSVFIEGEKNAGQNPIAALRSKGAYAAYWEGDMGIWTPDCSGDPYSQCLDRRATRAYSLRQDGYFFDAGGFEFKAMAGTFKAMKIMSVGGGAWSISFKLLDRRGKLLKTATKTFRCN